MNLRLRRPYGWGLLLLSDAESRDIPESVPGLPVVATPTAIAVHVRHAQDVDYEGGEAAPCVVNVTVDVGSVESPVDFEGELRLLSGTLLVGDAEQEQAVSLAPGTYQVQVVLDHPEWAENVHVWLTATSVA